MELRIIHRKDGIYDIYDKATGKWLFSRGVADNVFVELSKLPVFRITFVDELWQNKMIGQNDKMKNDFIYEEMKQLHADGVDFVPITFFNGTNAPQSVYGSYTKEEWVTQSYIIKSPRFYWRIDENGQKQYIDNYLGDQNGD